MRLDDRLAYGQAHPARAGAASPRTGTASKAGPATAEPHPGPASTTATADHHHRSARASRRTVDRGGAAAHRFLHKVDDHLIHQGVVGVDQGQPDRHVDLHAAVLAPQPPHPRRQMLHQLGRSTACRSGAQEPASIRPMLSRLATRRSSRSASSTPGRAARPARRGRHLVAPQVDDAAPMAASGVRRSCDTDRSRPTCSRRSTSCSSLTGLATRGAHRHSDDEEHGQRQQVLAYADPDGAHRGG